MACVKSSFRIDASILAFLVWGMSAHSASASERLACPSTREVEANVQTEQPGQANEVATRRAVSLPLAGMMLNIKGQASEETQYQIPRTWQLPPGVFQEWGFADPYPDTIYLHCAYGQDGVFSILLVSQVPFDRCRVMRVKGKPVKGRPPVDTVEAFCERLEDPARVRPRS
jgi:hypothetical protein